MLNIRSFLHSLVAYLVKFVVTNILIELEALEIAIHLNVRAAVNLANISSKIAATHEHICLGEQSINDLDAQK